MKIQINASWLFLIICLIASIMPLILETAYTYLKLATEQLPNIIIYQIEYIIVLIIKVIINILGWLVLFFFAASFFGYKFRMETANDNENC